MKSNKNAKQEWAERQVEILNNKMAAGEIGLFGLKFGKPLRFASLENAPAIGVIRLPDGKTFRVFQACAAVNLAYMPQITVDMEQFDDLAQAVALFDHILEMHGFLSFGDTFHISKSGPRFIRDNR